MAKHGLWLGALMGFLAFGLGSFGAHGLEYIIPQGELWELAKRIDTWQIATRYLMYHALIAFVVGMMGQFNRHKVLEYAMFCFVGGSAVFSGALYVLALSGQGWLGMVAPIGGVVLLAGWLLLVVAGYQATQPRKKKKKTEATA